MNAFGAQHMGLDHLKNWVQRNDAGVDPIGERGRIDFDALPRVSRA